MGFFDKIFSLKKNQKRNITNVGYVRDQFLSLIGAVNKTQVRVTDKNSMTFAAYWRCINLIASTVAKMPISAFRNTENGKDKLINYPLNKLLKDRPNKYMSAFTFYNVMEANRQIHGNAYAEIVRSENGGATQLLPYPSGSNCKISFQDENIYYTFYTDIFGNVINKTLNGDDVIHIKGYSWGGIVGVSTINYHANTIGIGLSSDQTAAEFFGNGAIQTGYLSHPGRLSDTGKDHLRKGWNNAASFDTPLLMEGVKFEPISMPLKDAQFLETRKFSGIQMCQIFGVPPSKIFDTDKATLNNMEVENMGFYTDTILPILTSWEQELKEKLLFDNEKRDTFFKFNVNVLLRADIKTRFESYAIGIRSGFLSINQVMSLEDMNTIEEGNEHYLQAQMETVKNINSRDRGEEESEEETEEERNSLKYLEALKINGFKS